MQQSIGIIVIGPFRSGTSLVSGLLAGLGVNFGRLSETSPPPDRYNPLGYFQRPEVVSANSRFIVSARSTQEYPALPQDLSLHGNRDILGAVDLSWQDKVAVWGMKDPRFSATLLSWIEAGRISRNSLKLVRVMRNIEAIAKSIMNHREVREYCGSDRARAVEMSMRYDSLAAWTEENLGVLSFRVQYELLISQPATQVARLAEFIGAPDQSKVRRSTRLIGRRRALLHHYVRKVTHPTLLAATVAKTVRAKLA